MTLVAYWPLDEDSGTTGYDYSGHDHNLTVNGATVNVNGPLGGSAYSFDGVDDYLETTTLPDFSGPNALTVSAWCKSPNVNWNTTGWLVSRRNQFIIHPEGSVKEVDFYVNTATAGWSSVSYSPADITIWHHYLQTYDGSTLRAYVDGVEVGSIAINETLTNDTGPTQIGHDEGKTDRYGEATISNVRIYDHALTPAEIQYLYSVSQHATRTTSQQHR